MFQIVAQVYFAAEKYERARRRRKARQNSQSFQTENSLFQVRTFCHAWKCILEIDF